MKKTAVVALTLTLLGAFSTAALAQQPFEYKVTVYGGIVKGSPGDHFVTLPDPVQLPDTTLRAGTYIFKIIEPSVVQVTSTDRSIVYTTFFTVPAMRPTEANDYALSLLPRGKLTPLVTKMFLGNGPIGFEPLYSQEVRGER
jgi:hypothetical protein